MHLAIVAHEELGGEATAEQVARKLRWRTVERNTYRGLDGDKIETVATVWDVKRAETALLAAAERGYVGSPR